MVSQARLVDRLCLDIRYSLMPSGFFIQAISFLLIIIRAPSTTAALHTRPVSCWDDLPRCFSLTYHSTDEKHSFRFSAFYLLPFCSYSAQH